MNYNNEIVNFSSWIIPSGEGVVYMEGEPTKEERAQNRKHTAKRRKNWHIWQFTDKASIEGISKKVDLNVLNTQIATAHLYLTRISSK